MLDKAIIHGKEHRKPYRRAKAIDRTCRNHGSCEWCLNNRLHKMRDKRYTKKEIRQEGGGIFGRSDSEIENAGDNV